MAAFVAKLEGPYGRAERSWVMDRVIPTDETLAPMQASDSPICCLVGMPRGRLSQMEQAYPAQSWTQVRAAAEPKLLGPTYPALRAGGQSRSWRQVATKAASEMRASVADSQQGRILVDSPEKRPYFSSQSYRQSGE